MSDNLRVGISANDVQILKDGEPVAGFTAGLALYVGSHVLKHVHADNPQAVEEIERALRLQDKDGRLAEACAQRKFDVQLLADGDVCCWLDDRIGSRRTVTCVTIPSVPSLPTTAPTRS